MSNEIKMPALSPTMTEGILSKWLVKIGDEVRSGDVIAEIETDKATMEVEAVDDGAITEILIQEGSDSVPVGAVIARMSGDDSEELGAPSDGGDANVNANANANANATMAECKCRTNRSTTSAAVLRRKDGSHRGV